MIFAKTWVVIGRSTTKIVKLGVPNIVAAGWLEALFVRQEVCITKGR